MYSIWHNYLFILLLFYYWLLVLASIGHHQANVYKKLKMLVHIVQKRRFYGIPFTIIRSPYNYYQPLAVLSVESCIEIFILWVLWMYFQKFFFYWLTTLKSKIMNNFKIFHTMCIRCVMKVASTFEIFITNIVTLIKSVKLIKLVFGSQLVSSAAYALGIFCILSELSAWCCMLTLAAMHLVGIFMYS